MKATILKNDSGEKKLVLVEKEMEKLSEATCQELIENGWSHDDVGGYTIENMDEENEKYIDDETGEEIDLSEETVDDLYSISYWDGSNWKTDIFGRDDFEEIEITLERLEDPNPAYYFRYNIIFSDGESIEATDSNMSGSFSPYLELEAGRL